MITSAVEFCHDVTGKGQVNENLIKFYAKELHGISEVQLKAAFNHFSAAGIFPNVNQLREKAGIKTEYSEGLKTEGGMTHEQIVKSNVQGRTPHTAYSFYEPYVIELWAPREIKTAEEALSCFEEHLKELESKGVFRDTVYSLKIVPWRVHSKDIKQNGNKEIEVKVEVFKAHVVCRTVRTEQERITLQLAKAQVISEE